MIFAPRTDDPCKTFLQTLNEIFMLTYLAILQVCRNRSRYVMARQKTWGQAASSSHTSSIQEATSRRIPGLNSVWRPENAVLEAGGWWEVRLWRNSLLSSILSTRSLRKMLGSLEPRREVRLEQPPVSTATMSVPSILKCDADEMFARISSWRADVSSTKVSAQLRRSCRGSQTQHGPGAARPVSVFYWSSSSFEFIEFMARFNARNINENMILLSNLRSANINWRVRVIKYILSPCSHHAKTSKSPRTSSRAYFDPHWWRNKSWE